MANQTDPDLAKMKASILRLEKMLQVMTYRIAVLEKENKRLRGAIGRATENVGAMERRLPTIKK